MSSAAARSCALMFFIVLSLAEAASQAYYPLEPGNSWRYNIWRAASPAVSGPETVTITVLSDTVLPGGDRFAQLDAQDALGGTRIHADSAAISYRSDWDSSASPVFDLTGSAGHVYALNWGPYFSANVTAIDTVVLFGRPTRRMHYRFDGLAVLEVTLAEGFGIVGARDWGDGCMFPCQVWEFLGCTIRDTVYEATGVGADPGLPAAMDLIQNYPNPFNPATILRFDVPASGFVSLSVHDMLGREIASLVREERGPGRYQVTWDATGSASGVYFFRYRSGSLAKTIKGLLLR